MILKAHCQIEFRERHDIFRFLGGWIFFECSF